ncbi:MAG: hypothetical protein R3F51_15030 [Cyanobacteriota/Melainabacteria group bacterium]
MIHVFFSSSENERKRLVEITKDKAAKLVASTPNGRGWGYRGFVHPLSRPMESHPVLGQISDPNSENAPLVFGFLLGTTPVSTQYLFQRIDEVTTIPELLDHVIPDDSEIGTLRVPLQQAVSAFVLEHWLAVIAMCGICTEMLSVLMFQLALPKLRERSVEISEEQKTALIAPKKFSSLGQAEREKFLKALNIADESITEDLAYVRVLRNKYVHPSVGIKKSKVNQKEDALIVLKKTVKLVENCLIVGTESLGMVLWNPLVFDCLEKSGSITTTTIMNPK